MQPEDGAEPEIFTVFRNSSAGAEFKALGRFEFYKECPKDNAVVLAVSTVEQFLFANILLTVGVA
jgi:L-fucose mutarotase/ribose pyranase (RbsD/FucU family)